MCSLITGRLLISSVVDVFKSKSNKILSANRLTRVYIGADDETTLLLDCAQRLTPHSLLLYKQTYISIYISRRANIYNGNANDFPPVPRRQIQATVDQMEEQCAGNETHPVFFPINNFLLRFFFVFLPNQIKEYIIFELVERGK